MLYIRYKIPKESIIREKQWHVGESSPIPVNNSDCVISIQADGHELDHIINQYCVNIDSHPYDRKYTIPVIPTARVMSWVGSIAQTIIQNL